jgi:hypothetical protein
MNTNTTEATRIRYARQAEAERAANPTCGGCGGDLVVAISDVICPSCESERHAHKS